MKKNSVRDSAAQIWIIFKKLPPRQKIKVIQKLEKETREERWDALTEKLSRRFRTHPISDEEITQIVNEVRQERYDRRQSRS